MAIPTSGQLSWSLFRNEFGDTNPVAISEYYRGGLLVPNTTTNANVPTSPGTIRASNFYGAADISFPSTGIAEANLVFDPSDANAAIIFSNNGTWTTGDGSGSGNWIDPPSTGVGSGYQILFTTTSGTLSSGTTGTWLSFPQTIARTQTILGASQWSGNVQIRDIATSTVQVTRGVQLDAEVA